MKNHKAVTQEMSIYDLEGPIEKLSERLIALTPKYMVNPLLHISQGYDYCDAQIVGWVPMAPEEILKAEQKLQKEKERAKILKEKQKAGALDRLIKSAKKLGMEVKPLQEETD